MLSTASSTVANAVRKTTDRGHIQLAGAGKDIQSLAIRHFLIGDHCVVLVRGKTRSSLGKAGSLSDNMFILCQVRQQNLSHIPFVVDDQDSPHYCSASPA
jgi:hypothetical protein